MSEEIIIDDVNVSECEFLRNCIIPDNYGCKIDDSLCCDVGNCYYKQLQRLKQENKELKKQYNCYACDSCAGKEDYRNMKRHCENAIKTVHKYNNALKEIRKYCEEQCKYNCGISFHNCHDKPRIDCLFYRIKTKIEQVLNV